MSRRRGQAPRRRAARTPLGTLITALTYGLIGLVAIVYATLGGIAALAIFGFLYALLSAG